MRYAMYFEDQYVYASRYDGEKDTPGLMNFEGNERLRTHFQIVDGRLRLAEEQENANVVLHTDNADVLTFSVTATDDREILEKDDDDSVSDALFLVCKRFAESISDPRTADVVFIGGLNPSLSDAAGRVGFRSTAWMDTTEAAIREWQWVSPEAGAARDVVVLRCSASSLEWNFRVAEPLGDFIIPDRETRSYGGFNLTGEESTLNVGVKRFIDWMVRIGGSQHIVICGSHRAMLADSEFVSAFEMRGQEVFVSDLVLGGARRAFPKFEAFDAAVKRSLKALHDARDAEDENIVEAFNTAIKAFNAAESLFDFEMSDVVADEINELRRRLRLALLDAASTTETVEDGCFLAQLAMKCSVSDAETAEIHAHLAAYYIKIADYVKAENAALSAYVLDTLTYPDIMANTALVIDSHKTLEMRIKSGHLR